MTDAIHSSETIFRMVNQLMEDEFADNLSEWETDFVYDMSVRLSKSQMVSENQRNKVVEIFNDRVVNAG